MDGKMGMDIPAAQKAVIKVIKLHQGHMALDEGVAPTKSSSKLEMDLLDEIATALDVKNTMKASLNQLPQRYQDIHL